MKPTALAPGTTATLPERMAFTPGHLERRYFSVPAGATWVDFVIKGGDVFGVGDDATDRRLHLIHAQQLLQHTPHRESMLEQYLWMTPGAQKCLSMKVVAGGELSFMYRYISRESCSQFDSLPLTSLTISGTLELVMGQFWNSLLNSELTVTTSFHGLLPSNAAPVLTQGEKVQRIDVSVAPGLRPETLGPVASLTHAASSARPTKAAVRPLSAERDVLPRPSGGQIYALDLEYAFEMKAKCAAAQVVINSVDSMLYDSPLMAQLTMVFDSAGKLLGYSDFKGAAPYTLKLDKGVRRKSLRSRSCAASCMRSRCTQPPSPRALRPATPRRALPTPPLAVGALCPSRCELFTN